MRSIGRTLDSLTDIRPLLEQVRALAALQARYARCMTAELATRSRITHEHGGIVYVQADTAAVAAKLRNLTTRIFEELRSECPNLTGIHVGTQPTPGPAKSRREPRQLDDEGRLRLSQLSETLNEGPLKDALHRWSKR